MIARGGASDIEKIVSTLTNNGVTATFFVVGTWVNEHPEAVKRLYDAGMEVGNHSFDHAHVNELSYAENVEDMMRCNEVIENVTGEDVKYYRGPYGEYNNFVMQAAEYLGMQVIQWDVDTLDYTGKTLSEMCARIKNKIRNGSIILMHNDTKHTAEGLQQIIDFIHEEGFEIVPLDELVYKEGYKVNYDGRQMLR